MTSPAQLHYQPEADIRDIEVAPGCQWSSNEWRFPVTVPGTSPAVFRIRWDFEIEPGVLLTSPEYADLLDAWRRVLWCLMRDPGDGQMRRMSICARFSTALRSLVPFMVQSGRPDLSFIDPSCVRDYSKYLAKQKLQIFSDLDDDLEDEEPFDQIGITNQAAASYFSIFIHAWWARNALISAGLPAPPDQHPLEQRTAFDWATAITFRDSRPTEEIPDSTYTSSMNAAASLITGVLAEPLIKFSVRAPTLDSKTLRRSCEDFLHEHAITVDRDWPENNMRRLISDLRAACNIILQGASGVRVSELCGIEAGDFNQTLRLPSCIDIERTFDEEFELFFLVARVYKGTGGSRRARWVLGMRPTGASYVPLPVRAIDVLFRLDRTWRAKATVGELLVSFNNSNGLPLGDAPVAPMLSSRVRERQQEWLQRHGGLYQEQRITTHMWRKTFARYMVRVSPGLLPAISHHLKHMSVAFTEVAYCQPDPEAARTLTDARTSEAGALILGVITGKKPVAGPMAAELKALAKELSSGLGNRTEHESREKLGEAIRDRNIRLYHQDFGFCVFRGDGARCHNLADDSEFHLLRVAPAFARQTADICASCKNFGIDASHFEFWRDRIKTFRTRLANCGTDAPIGYRTLLRRQIGRCETVLNWTRSSHAPQ